MYMQVHKDSKIQTISHWILRKEAPGKELLKPWKKDSFESDTRSIYTQADI